MNDGLHHRLRRAWLGAAGLESFGAKCWGGGVHEQCLSSLGEDAGNIFTMYIHNVNNHEMMHSKKQKGVGRKLAVLLFALQ